MDDMPVVDSWIADAIAALPGAVTVPYPDWGSQTFQVGGKHFGRLGGDPEGRRIVTVKGDPEVNAALVAAHDAITPGYYANKRLWISLAIDDPDLERDLVIEALENGYAIVRDSLPRRVRESLDPSA
ncbi:MmcQ/YjbR family DNA-binding protein [Demequina zhanjiangensis]|uniref:MmcQ/YjbR family DNA-binding protein n=1 Tax=Demequina zhanjiangensis TaxID=3051659 RepID=A0ABT8FY52_9MICO|nr:MmcQ/YjbR family DNA-binding protein [Demequina sp. SYSU T00b26]MDN4471738.1 MmcQ/YjbR family DNA-binding protein [Demequina sp. SYSU T00b26]